MYLVEKKSAKAISVEVGCHADTINAWLHRYGIIMRSRSEGLSLACKGRVSPNKGNKWTDEHHRKHLELWADPEFRARVIPKRSGANSNLWKGGTSDPSNVHLARVDWLKRRDECYVRDNGICQDCRVKCLSRAEIEKRGHPERRIQAHHIISRRTGGGDELSNLVTLCVSCHHKRERRYADALFA